MSEEEKSISDATQDPSGDQEKQETPQVEQREKSEDVVAYSTYKKLLSEAKKAKETLKELQEAEKTRKEAELREKEDYKELLALREKELKELKTQVTTYNQQQQNSLKLEAFLDSIDGKIDKKYWGHIPLEKIKLNPDTQEIDHMSVTSLVENFRKEYPEIIQVKGKSSMPSDAPRNTGAGISYEEWLKLPAKEMRKQMANVIKGE